MKLKDDDTILHISIDLETLGTIPGSPILSIGARAFSLEETFNGFHVILPLQEQFDKGMVVEARTLYWWIDQVKFGYEFPHPMSAGTTEELLVDLVEWADAEREMNKFVDVRVWGYGSDFDIALLKFLFCQFNVPWPRNFKGRCLRTLLDEYGTTLKELMPDWPRNHDALEDATYQALAIQQLLRGKYAKG